MRQKIDYTGQRFGRLTVIEEDLEWRKHRKRPEVKWICKCDCGNIVSVCANELRKGSTQSCGCYQKDRTREVHCKDLSGKRFGKLTVLKEDLEYNLSKNPKKQANKYICQCDCGNIISVRRDCLMSGQTKSCGCLASPAEGEMQKFCRQNNLNYSTQYSFPDLYEFPGHPYRFDLALYNSKNELIALVEYNGCQHYRTTRYTDPNLKKRDEKKEEYCQKNSIPLFKIDKREDIEKVLNNIIKTLDK